MSEDLRRLLEIDRSFSSLLERVFVHALSYVESCKTFSISNDGNFHSSLHLPEQQEASVFLKKTNKQRTGILQPPKS